VALPPAVEVRRKLSDRARSVRLSGTALAVGAIFLVGLGLRLFWVFYTDTIPLGGDPAWYLHVAENVAKGFGYTGPRNEFNAGQPTAFWPPGYSIALAGVFKVFGASITSAQVFNAVCGALAIPFVYALGARIFNRQAGLLAAGIFACFPNSIAWTPVLFPEPLFVLLFVAALWLLVAAPATGRGAWLAIAGFGALTGLAALTRGQGVTLIAIAALYWLMRSGWRPALRSTALALVAVCAVIAPWTVRNAIQLHAFVPISTNAGVVLREGHAPDTTGRTYWPRDEVDGFATSQSPFRSDWEVRGYRAYTRRAIGYAFTHPQREVRASGLKVYYLYSTDSGVVPWLTTLGATPIRPAGLERALWHVFDYSYYLLLFGALLSIPLWLRRDADRCLLIGVVAIWTVYHIIFTGDPRYHVPLYPVFAVAVAAGALAALDRARAALARRSSLERSGASLVETRA
jgi:4-amino-4-deoxy-L-arabinose transferase-like glycosyltransferase